MGIVVEFYGSPIRDLGLMCLDMTFRNWDKILNDLFFEKKNNFE